MDQLWVNLMKKRMVGLAGVSVAVALLSMGGCTSVDTNPDKGGEDESSIVAGMQGVAMAPNHQIQRYLATRWGNVGRGGAAELQPGYIHVLLGEDDPQGADPYSYDMALQMRDAMDRRASEMARMRKNQREARRIRHQQEDIAMKDLMNQLSVASDVVGLEPGVYATKQPSAQQIRLARKSALDKSRDIERQRFNSTSEEMSGKIHSMNSLMQTDRWRMACAGYHDLLDEGDYAQLLEDGFQSDAIPMRCSGLHPTQEYVQTILVDLCTAEPGYSSKAEFFRRLFMRKGIDTRLYSKDGKSADRLCRKRELIDKAHVQNAPDKTSKRENRCETLFL